MKVLHLVQKPQLRGAEVFACQLAMHMTAMGHKAVVVSLFPGGANLPFDGTTYNLNGNPSNRLRDFKAWRRLAKIIKEENPDIIQANAGDTLKYAVLSKLIFRWKQPVVFRNASTISLYIKTPSAVSFNGFFFRYADKVISVSDTSASDFSQLYPAYKEKVTTVPIGIEKKDLKAFVGSSIDSQFRKSGPLLLHVGGFSFEKNHTGLIRIFKNICKVYPGASLHLVGDGPLKNEVEELVSREGLQASVQFYGFRPNALQFMKSADALLLPSIIEGLPGVILEAFYCKTPVVAYDVGGIREVLSNDQTGYIIPGGNEDAFAGAVLKSLEKNDFNAKLKENAYRLVTEQFSNETIAQEFLKTYQEILSKTTKVSVSN